MVVEVHDIKSESELPLAHQRVSKEEMGVMQLPRVGDTMLFAKSLYSRPNKIFGKWKVVDVVFRYGEPHYLIYQLSDDMAIKIYVERIQEEE